MTKSARLAIPSVLLLLVILAWLAVGELDSKAARVELLANAQTDAWSASEAMASSTSTATPSPKPTLSSRPSIHYFTCLPCEILKGETSTLSWDLSGATAAYLDGYGVTAPGSTVVAPDQTTTYRLEALGEGDSVERLVTITVKEGGDPEAVSQTLRRPGYDVRWVGFLPLAGGEDTISVIMTATADDLHSHELADQYFAAFKALYDNYPGGFLTVALYDGVRYMFFVTVESGRFEAFLRGEIDGYVFWRAANWNTWDDWTGRWLDAPGDFVSKSFGY